MVCILVLRGVYCCGWDLQKHLNTLGTKRPEKSLWLIVVIFQAPFPEPCANTGLSSPAPHEVSMRSHLSWHHPQNFTLIVGLCLWFDTLVWAPTTCVPVIMGLLRRWKWMRPHWILSCLSPFSKYFKSRQFLLCCRRQQTANPTQIPRVLPEIILSKSFLIKDGLAF